MGLEIKYDFNFEKYIAFTQENPNGKHIFNRLLIDFAHGRSQDFFSGGGERGTLRKFSKCIILSYLSKYLTNHALIFCALDDKCKLLENFYENSIEKLNF